MLPIRKFKNLLLKLDRQLQASRHSKQEVSCSARIFIVEGAILNLS